MHVKRLRLPDFDTYSVALFATLALGGTLPPRAQQVTARPPFTSTTSMVAPAPAEPETSSTTASAPPDRRTAEHANEAFSDADSNKDGSISSPGFDEALK